MREFNDALSDLERALDEMKNIEKRLTKASARASGP